MRSAWAAAHHPVDGVPPWARRIALLIPLLVLPSSLWRIAVCTFHVPIIEGGLPADASGNLPSWLPLEIYVVLLSIGSELLGFAAVGLVAGWGEVFPRWIPLLRGRRVPPLAAILPAAMGATVLTLLTLWTTITLLLGVTVRGDEASFDVLTFHTWQGTVAIAAYAPLLLWGPLLGAVTVAYHHRRRGE
jgi:hypothetical protein